MLKNRKLILLLVLIMVVGVSGFFTPSKENQGGIDTVSASTVTLGSEIGRQTICINIDDLTVIDTDDLDDEITIIEDEDDLDAGTINIYSNQDAKITAYHDDSTHLGTNPEDFENAVVLFQVRLNAVPPGLGYQSLLGTDENNAVDLTGNIKGFNLTDVPVQYNIGLEWDDPPEPGTYCTDVVFTLEEY